MWLQTHTADHFFSIENEQKEIFAFKCGITKSHMKHAWKYQVQGSWHAETQFSRLFPGLPVLQGAVQAFPHSLDPHAQRTEASGTPLPAPALDLEAALCSECYFPDDQVFLKLDY